MFTCTPCQRLGNGLNSELHVVQYLTAYILQNISQMMIVKVVYPSKPQVHHQEKGRIIVTSLIDFLENEIVT